MTFEWRETEVPVLWIGMPRRGTEVALPARLVISLHVASLDAPTVAVVWQYALARCTGVTLAADAYVVLFLSVWLAYAADRRLDVVRARSDDVTTDRHRFARRFARPLGALWLVVFALAIALSLTRLDGALVESGWVLFGLVLLYLGLAQWHRFSGIGVPKEVVAGVLFAIGTGWFATVTLVTTPGVAPSDLVAAAVAVGGFALLCVLNCLAISRWEYGLDRNRGESEWMSADALVAIVRNGTAVLAVASVLAILSVHVLDLASASRPGATAFFLALALAACGIAWLDRLASRVRVDLLRACADWMLLTPVLVAWIG